MPSFLWWGGGIALNLLPILMTAINIASSIIYTKSAPLREKIQTFALAGIFLVLLYNSPSGLVFYWVLNQVFSLCKNIVKKMKRPGRIVYVFLCAMLLAMCGYLILLKDNKFSTTKCCFYILTLIFIAVPFVWNSLKAKKIFEKIKLLNVGVSDRQNFALLLLSCISLCLLCGLLLPSSVIATSPAEFSFLGSTDSPLSYVWASLVFFAGLFVFWPIVIYKMFSDNKTVKAFMPSLFFVLAMCALANAFLFKYDYGTISVFFMIDNIKVLDDFSPYFSILPLLFMFAIFVSIFFIIKFKKNKFLVFFILAICLAECSAGFFKTNTIKNNFKSICIDFKSEKSFNKNSKIVPQFHFSKTQPNVLVLFLDKAASAFFPYILEQFPEMKKSYDGFVYYPNCLSFGNYTNCGTTAMMGGYEYTIDEINKRNEELLKDKHNEATLVMPKIFSNAGYDTTIHEVPYLNYEEKPIPSEFDFTTISTDSQKNINIYKDLINMEVSNSDKVCSAALKDFVIMQIIYPILRKTFSNRTDYYIANKALVDENFVNAFASLYFLAENFDDKAVSPTFHFIGNITAHEYTTLREGFVPGRIDSEHPAAGTGIYKWYYDGPGFNDFQGYHVNAAAHIQVAKFLDALKENEIYDNTRIIIVADHGSDGIMLPPFEQFNIWRDAAHLNPLLLFKDFNSHGDPIVDDTIKTNAETVWLAVKDLPVEQKNPFTGKEIQTADNFSSFNVYILNSPSLEKIHALKQYPDDWKRGYTVHTNIFDENNWKKLDTSEAVK